MSRNDSRRNVKKVIFDFNPDGKEASTEAYGPCSDLADYIRTLAENGLTPIAFIHGKTTRHSVLPALACEDMVMASGSQIGQVSGGSTMVTKNQTDHYLTLAGIPRTAAVLKMIDKNVKLYQAKYKGTVIYVDKRKVDDPNREPAYAEVHITKLTPEPMSPSVELYGVEQARKYGICKLQRDTIEELLEWYQLPPSILQGNPLGTRAMKPVRIMIEGAINTALREKLRRQIESAKARDENMFFFVIETTANGDPKAAHDIADDLIALGKDKDYRTERSPSFPATPPIWPFSWHLRVRKLSCTRARRRKGKPLSATSTRCSAATMASVSTMKRSAGICKK